MLDNFINSQQLEILNNTKHEEHLYFKAISENIKNIIDNMPMPYGTDGVKNPIAHLHYYIGNCDWYITERDSSAEQHQAHGYANLGYGFEAGYISIEELKHLNVELDFHFEPTPIKALI